MRTTQSEARILRAVQECHRTIKGSYGDKKTSRHPIKTDFDSFVKLNGTSKNQTRGIKFAEQSAAWRSAHQHDIQALSNTYFQPSPAPTGSEITDSIVQSLRFQEIKDRWHQIGARPAYPKTFSWVFDKAWQGQPLGSGFAEWMEQGDSGSLYWVAGCPGSGKSTLMHFLSEASQTEEKLALWRGSKDLLKASSFFWLSGSPIQKSLNGLLRSLLHSLFTQAPQLVQQSASWRWRASQLGVTSLPEWSNAELIETFRNFTAAVASTNNCMFLLIDGLDEFDGKEMDRVELVGYLKTLGASPCVKLCVSSRPWPVFQSAFESGPNLRLEQLTHGDISLFVNEKFEKLRAFQNFTLLYPTGCKALTQSVVVKAQGVFLWVYLVVASLSRGMEDGLTMKQLHNRLDEIPGDLEAYFRKIILAVPEEYRCTAASYFALSTDVHHKISLLSLSFLEVEELESIDKYSQAALLSASKQATTQRLESRCGGLLQISQRVETGIYRDQYVDFLHRTVREFLHSEDIQLILQANLPPAFEPLLILCRSVLAQLETISPEHQDLEGLAQDFLYYAGELESQPHCPGITLIEQFFSQVYGHLLQTEEARRKFGSRGSILTVAICYRLTSFAEAEIERGTISLNSCHGGRLCGDEVCPLLRRCFPSLATDDEEQWQGHRFNPVEHMWPQDVVVAALFAKGADPNLKINDMTIWETFLEQAEQIRRLDNPGKSAFLDDDSWIRTTRLFIDHGASARGRDPRPDNEWRIFRPKHSFYRISANKYHRRRGQPETAKRLVYISDDLADVVEGIFGGESGKSLASALRNRNSLKDRFGRLFRRMKKQY